MFTKGRSLLHNPKMVKMRPSPDVHPGERAIIKGWEGWEGREYHVESRKSQLQRILKTIALIALRRWWIFAFLLLVNVVSFIQGSTSSSWAKYVRSPNNRIVYPKGIIDSYTTGDVTNPTALLASGGGVTTFNREAPAAPPSWPKGTTANASSYHPANTNNGQPRTYLPSNAIDGDVTTFWNDNTIGAYPDILTLMAPTAVSLSGITILSSSDGVPVDFTVSALQSSGSWVLAATVTNNSAVQIQVPFTGSVSTKGIRITVTKDQSTRQGEFTRITEVWPGIVPNPPLTPAVVVDFGQVVVGFLSISFAGASDNNPGIRLAFSETTQFLTDLCDFTRSFNGDSITPGSDQIAVAAEPYVWTDDHGCLDGKKVCADGLHGFRYVKIYLDALAADSPKTQANGTVTIDSVSLDFTAYLGTEDTFSGTFECSDTTLNQFWYDAAYTSELCIDTFRVNDTEPRNAASPSLIGKLVIHDGPKRDRDPYVGDVAVAGRSLYLTHNASIAAENVLADLADHQRSDGWIPPASINDYTLPLFDYPLYWVTCSYDLIVYTASDSYAQKYYPTLLKVLDNFYPSMTDSATGLLNKPSSYGDFAFLPRSGIITYYNALYVQALNNAASIARFYNHPSDASRWTQRAQNVSAAINAHLWDASVGAYYNTISDGTHGQDGNSIAVLNSIADSTRATATLKYWASLALPYGNPVFDSDAMGGGLSQRVYAFMSYFELQARFASGQGDSAIEEIRRLYGWMAAHDPEITMWEGIGPGGSHYEGGYTSASHAWSTGVLPILSNHVLGVLPTGPGFSEWTVTPTPVGGVAWARGQVGTPRGPLVVDWTTRKVLFQFQVTVTVPEGTEGYVSVPASRKSVLVFVNALPTFALGKGLLHTAQYGDGRVTVHLTAGKHIITVSR